MFVESSVTEGSLTLSIDHIVSVIKFVMLGNNLVSINGNFFKFQNAGKPITTTQNNDRSLQARTLPKRKRSWYPTEIIDIDPEQSW